MGNCCLGSWLLDQRFDLSFTSHDNLEWTVRNNLDEAERYVKFLRLKQEAEKAKKQED